MDKSGIYSLAGYSYQIKMFVLEIPKLNPGYKIEFETIDDIAINADKETIDNYEDDLCTLFHKDDTLAIQVKRKAVSSSVAQEVLVNWMLIYARNSVGEFCLVSDRPIPDDAFTSLKIEDIADKILMSEGTKSNLAKLRLLGFTRLELVDIASKIISSISLEVHNNIEEDIYKDFSDYFFKSAVMEPTYYLRVEQLIREITVKIINAVSSGQSYVLTYEDTNSIRNKIIETITDDKYSPSYSEYRKLNKINLDDISIIRPRETRQLRECTELSDEDIINNLMYGEYYSDCKRNYFERGMKSLVEDIECTAYDNFSDVKLNLKINNEDTPYKRLSETKNRDNTKASDDQIRYGVCIALTSDKTDKSMQISWKDE